MMTFSVQNSSKIGKTSHLRKRTPYIGSRLAKIKMITEGFFKSAGLSSSLNKRLNIYPPTEVHVTIKFQMDISNPFLYEVYHFLLMPPPPDLPPPNPPKLPPDPLKPPMVESQPVD